MYLSFENSVISEENSLLIPEVNDGVRLSDGSDIRAKELLELMEAARINGDE
ncbi:MAG: hypothetical protein J5999_02900 [Oscillospiraceae bacterium]|nr:hypothetical protein [Oscillospiraceae bacterium]